MSELIVKNPPPHTQTMEHNKSFIDKGAEGAHAQTPGTPPAATTTPATPPPPAVVPPVDANMPPATTPNTEPPAQQPPVAKAKEVEDMTDEELEELAAKIAKRRPEPKPLTKEEKEAAEKKESEDALAWAISNNVVPKDKYDAAIADKTKSDREIALKVFAASEREDNPKATDEEIEELFKDHYREELEDTHPARKAALKAMNKAAKEYRSQYSDVDSLVENFRTYSTEQAKYKGYTKQVNEVVKAMPKDIEISVPSLSDTGAETTVSYQVPVDESIINKVKADFAKEAMYVSLGVSKADLKPEDLQSKMMYHLKALTYDKAIAHVAKVHAEKEVENMRVRLSNSRHTPPSVSVPQAGGEKKAPPAHTQTMEHNKQYLPKVA